MASERHRADREVLAAVPGRLVRPGDETETGRPVRNDKQTINTTDPCYNRDGVVRESGGDM